MKDKMIRISWLLSFVFLLVMSFSQYQGWVEKVSSDHWGVAVFQGWFIINLFSTWLLFGRYDVKTPAPAKNRCILEKTPCHSNEKVTNMPPPPNKNVTPPEIVDDFSNNPPSFAESMRAFAQAAADWLSKNFTPSEPELQDEIMETDDEPLIVNIQITGKPGTGKIIFLKMLDDAIQECFGVKPICPELEDEIVELDKIGDWFIEKFKTGKIVVEMQSTHVFPKNEPLCLEPRNLSSAVEIPPCDCCKRPQTQLGALHLGPPLEIEGMPGMYCRKYHVCVECDGTMFDGI